MARHKLQQIQLVVADDKTLPPFPGGWVLAIFDAFNAFAPACASKHRLPASRRTLTRLKGGARVKRSTYDEIEANLVVLVKALFPTVSAINGFAAKYVNEYVDLWKAAAEIALTWIEALGYQSELQGVLARALVRDFILRLCYLESCERVLSGQRFKDEELALFRYETPTNVYGALIKERTFRDKCSLEELAVALGEGNHEKKLRRLKKGEAGPEWKLLQQLDTDGKRKRTLAGIGFTDILLCNLGIGHSAMNAEIMHVAEIFLSTHDCSMGNQGELNRFAEFARNGDNLLLHAGFEMLWPKMPDALWRAHLYGLQFARMVDLAQAYFQFSRPENDRELMTFLDNAERKSERSPYQWMRDLQHHNNVLPVPSTGNR